MECIRTFESSKPTTKKRSDLKCTTLVKITTHSSSVWSMINMEIRSIATLHSIRVSMRLIKLMDQITIIL
jgi:hypothetical protein